MTFSVLHLTAFGLQHVKDIHLMKSMEQFLDDHFKRKHETKGCFSFRNSYRKRATPKEEDYVNEYVGKLYKWINDKDFNDIGDELFEFVINDLLDVCIRIRQEPPRPPLEKMTREDM